MYIFKACLKSTQWSVHTFQRSLTSTKNIKLKGKVLFKIKKLDRWKKLTYRVTFKLIKNV